MRSWVSTADSRGCRAHSLCHRQNSEVDPRSAVHVLNYQDMHCLSTRPLAKNLEHILGPGSTENTTNPGPSRSMQPFNQQIWPCEPKAVLRYYGGGGPSRSVHEDGDIESLIIPPTMQPTHPRTDALHVLLSADDSRGCLAAMLRCRPRAAVHVLRVASWRSECKHRAQVLHSANDSRGCRFGCAATSTTRSTSLNVG